jgi:L-aminopeptidase/D-esterase-like protein
MPRVSVPASRGRRLRELGLRIGAFESGERDAITDVGGVRVGHVTVWSDEPGGRGIARTGVTAIVPGEGLFAAPAPAGAAVLNGAGEMTGFVADPLFAAAVDATEEAVLNALWPASDVTGRDGRTARGLPHEPVLALLREQGRLR